ncbi:trypsin-like peptidase domain-containing protein [Streptomyces sp. NPDC052301]|uniref:trypsin-like peptidase domain-containing protein n=1 Tax=Streptomyces sp. NPDC052301 TaxID=3365687 RepID=UPI0037D75224
MNEGNRVPSVEGPEGAAGVRPAEDVAGGGTGPDFELPRPATGEPAGAAADGDFELAKPTPVAAPERAATDATAEGAASTGPGERPKPLHDPDPYGTPPYGEPGPWAPAPPVQHPAAHGMTPADAPAPGVPHAPAPGVSHASARDPHAPVPGASGSAVPGGVPAPTTPPETTPVPEAPPAAGPWQRYDPWAAGSPEEQAALAQGPLQQTGVGVLTQEQRTRRGKRLLLVWTLAVALVCSAVGGLVGAYIERHGLDGDEVRLPQAGAVPAGRAPDSVAGIAARALPSVVTIHVTGSDEQGTGTGFVLDTDGHILTNNHVVAPAASGGSITVSFSTGDSVKAKVVGRDSGYDLAVVQVHGVHGLTPLPLGNSDTVKVGDPVVAIGAPFDLANTVTSGIISAKERPITAGGEKGDGSDVSYVDALQTDAPINPGNSGGPLLDSRAQVVGINSAIRSADSGSDSEGGQAGSIGLGFAIPVNQAKRVAEELINEGHATHPVIGVILDMGYTGDGARVDDKGANGGPPVLKGGPGERAGLKPGDVITEVDGQRVHTGEELIVKIRAHRPGDRLRLVVERGGTERDVSLVLGASEQN